jgi:hypothetical protein
MNMIITIFKSKTMMFALALAIFGVLEMNLKVFAPHLTPEFFGAFSILISIVVAVLRVLTTMPLDKK